MPRIARSVRFRLTCWYTAILAVVLAAFGATLYGVVRYESLHHHDDSLRDTARAVVSVLGREPDSARLTPDQVADLGHLDRLLLVHELAGEGQVFYQSPGLDPALLPRTATEIREILSQPESFRTVRSRSRALRVYSVRYSTNTGRLGAVRVVDPLGDLEEGLATLRWVLLMLIPISMFAAGGGGYWLAGRALRPVDEVTRLAREIQATDLSRRVPVPRIDDELGRLVTTVNQMIGRLEGAFDAMRRFSADASHELQTPLTIMRSSIEVGLEKVRSTAEYQRTLADLLEEVERLSRMAGDLLLLARADAGSLELRREPIRLDELTAESVECMKPLAEARGVGLSMVHPQRVAVSGDERWLRQMLFNLLDNAIKYTPTGGLVRVQLDSRDGAAFVSVADNGAGIAAEEQSRVFERFYRTREARGDHASGAGLGLSIALWIARSHGGDIRVQSQPGSGSTFRVSLPDVVR